MPEGPLGDVSGGDGKGRNRGPPVTKPGQRARKRRTSVSYRWMYRVYGRIDRRTDVRPAGWRANQLNVRPGGGGFSFLPLSVSLSLSFTFAERPRGYQYGCKGAREASEASKVSALDAVDAANDADTAAAAVDATTGRLACTLSMQ